MENEKDLVIQLYDDIDLYRKFIKQVFAESQKVNIDRHFLQEESLKLINYEGLKKEI